MKIGDSIVIYRSHGYKVKKYLRILNYKIAGINFKTDELIIADGDLSFTLSPKYKDWFDIKDFEYINFLFFFGYWTNKYKLAERLEKLERESKEKYKKEQIKEGWIFE